MCVIAIRYAEIPVLIAVCLLAVFEREKIMPTLGYNIYRYI